MRGSNNYITTVDPKDVSSMLELQTLRNLIKKQNALLRKRASQASMNYGPQKLVQFYVKCQGRGPRVKVTATEDKEVKAEYTFDKLKDAIVFENQMSKKGYTTQVERVLL